MTQYPKLSHDFFGKLDIGETACGDEAAVAHRRSIYVHRGPSVVGHVLLQILKTVTRVPTSREEARTRDRRGGRTDGGNWHRTRFERLKSCDQLALNRLLFPTITARQDEQRNVVWAELSESRSRLNGETAHRLNGVVARSEEHTSELQSRLHLVCRLLLEKKKKKITTT